MMGQKDKLENVMSKLGLDLTEQMLMQLIEYYSLLIEKNKVMNLTAITEFDEVVLKHFADSLSIVKAIDMNHISSLIDVGTGAGFPGIPLKIVFPDIHVTLMDSLNKRIRFLDEVIEALSLKDIISIHSRAEDLAKEFEHREHYDLTVSRAVAGLDTLSEYCLPFVRVGGKFVSYKSGAVEQELADSKKAISVLGGTIVKAEGFMLLDSDISRTMVVIEKVKPTPKTYPRKPGMAKAKPISLRQ